MAGGDYMFNPAPGLTWGQGVSDDDYREAGLNPANPDSWLQYQQRQQNVPSWITNPDDLKAAQQGWSKATGNWTSVGETDPNFQADQAALNKSMAGLQSKYYDDTMSPKDKAAGMAKYNDDYNAAQQALLRAHNIQQPSVNDRPDVINKLAGQAADNTDLAYQHLAGGYGFKYLPLDNLRQSVNAFRQLTPEQQAQQSMRTGGSFGAIDQNKIGQINRLGDYLDWQGNNSGADMGKADAAFTDWSTAVGQGDKTSWDDYWGGKQGMVRGAGGQWATPTTTPTPDVAAAAPAAPTPTVTSAPELPQFNANNSLTDAYKPQGLLGSAMKQPFSV